MIFEKHFLDKDIEEAKEIFREIERRLRYLDAFLKGGEFSDAEQTVYKILEKIRRLGDLNIEQQCTKNLLTAAKQLKMQGLEPMEIVKKYETKQN